MSRVDGLVAELAPEGVEYKALSEFLRIKNGKDHKALGDGEIPVYGSGGIIRYVDTAAAEGPSVLIPRKGSLGNIFYVEGPFWVVDTIFRTEIDRTLVEPKFVYHQLLTMGLGEMNQAGGVPSQTQSVLNLLRIPVPPLEVQREIVRILDQFTELEANLEAKLEAELEARQRQYEHYRDDAVGKRRLSNAEWVPLSSVTDIRTGAKPTALSESGSVPYINAGNEPSGFTSEPNVRGGAITIPSRGQGGAGHVGFQSADFWCGPLCYRVESRTGSLSTRFLYHYLKNVQEELIGLRKIGSIPAVNKSDLGRVLVPIVGQNEQERVVELLDRFEALVNDIRMVLPAELAARRKQYEYYRDKLLTFKEAV